jgi:hypothetical protein
MTDVDGYVFNDPRLPHSVPYFDSASWIQGFLVFFGLERRLDPLSSPGVPRFKYLFVRAGRQKFLSLAEVVAAVAAEGTADGRTLDRGDIERLVVGISGPELTPEDDDDDGGLSISFMITPRTWHEAKAGGSQDPSSLQVQCAYQFNITRGKKRTGGRLWSLDYSLQGQAQFFYDTDKKRVAGQVMFGGQLTLTEQNFLGKVFQLQEFVSMLDGITFTADMAGKNIRKTVSAPVVGTTQLGAGLQVNFKLSKSVTLFIQGQLSGTGSRDPDAHVGTLTVDQAVGVGVQISF